jgi:hypothetical protein
LLDYSHGRNFKKHERRFMAPRYRTLKKEKKIEDDVL